MVHAIMNTIPIYHKNNKYFYCRFQQIVTFKFFESYKCLSIAFACWERYFDAYFLAILALISCGEMTENTVSSFYAMTIFEVLAWLGCYLFRASTLTQTL